MGPWSLHKTEEGDMKKLNVKGFSMIELMVVLLIIGVLASVAAPMFLGNSDRAKASEAVAAIGAIRAGERTYYSQNSSFITNISSTTDSLAYFGSTGAGNGSKASILGVTLHGNKYFSPQSYTISTTSTGGAITTPQDFVILANGANSVLIASATDDNARNATDVNGATGGNIIQVQGDNSGAVYYKVGGGAWTAY